MRTLHLVRAALLFPALLWTGAVSAQMHDPAAARALANDAYEQKLLGNWEEARIKFEESERLDPSGKTLINLAECEDHRGQLASAKQHLVEARDMLSASGDTELREIAMKRLALFEARMPFTAARAPVNIGRTCLDRGDPWDGQVEITWRGPVCARGSRLALEGGDPWRLAILHSNGSAPSGDDVMSPLPKLVPPKLDQIDPWARLRPRVRVLRWPDSLALRAR